MDKMCVECHPECEHMNGTATCIAPVCVPNMCFHYFAVKKQYENAL